MEDPFHETIDEVCARLNKKMMDNFKAMDDFLMPKFNELESMIEASNIAWSKPRPYFYRDFDTNNKVMSSFGEPRPENADKWWERTNRINCVLLALKHDMRKLVDHLNEHRVVIPELPAYSAE